MGDLIEARSLRVGPVLAEARDAGVDEPPVAPLQRLVVDAEPGLHVGPEVLDDHVGGVDQPHEHLEAALALEVEGEPALVALEVLEVRPGPGPAEAARVVGRRHLDLDDIRAPVGKLPHAGGPGPHAGEIQHPKATERLTGRSMRHDRPPLGLSSIYDPFLVFRQFPISDP